MSKTAPKDGPKNQGPKNKPKANVGGKQIGKQSGKQAPRPVRKSRETLPQHEFPAPYNRLLTIGSMEYEDAEAEYAKIAAILTEADPQEAVARLTGVVLDASYDDYADLDHPERDDARMWTRLHAISVLSLMGDAAQAAVDPLLVLLDEEDDDLREEMPLFYAAVGQAAIEPLRRVLQNPDADTYLRTGAGDCLEQIGETHPSLRPTIVPLLEQSLMLAGTDDVLASFLVCNLLDLDAKESLPLIQQAYAEGRVDTSVVDMSDVEEHFGLKPAEPERLSLRATATEAAAALDENTDGQEAREPASAPFVKPVKLGRNEPCWCNSGKKYKQCHGG